MGQQKKPRNKQHVPRELRIPIMNETRAKLALDLHAAVEVLIHAPSIESYNDMSLRLITLGRCAGDRSCLESGKAALLSMFAQWERVGKMGASEDEARDLRLSSGGMDRLLALIPLNRLVASEEQTRRWCIANNVAA